MTPKIKPYQSILMLTVCLLSHQLLFAQVQIADSNRFDTKTNTLPSLKNKNNLKLSEKSKGLKKKSLNTLFPAIGIRQQTQIDSAQNDSTSKSTLGTLIKNIPLSGTLNWEYSYGWIPYLLQSGKPSEVYRAYGTMQTNTLGLPLLIDYNYSNAQVLSGMNNFFRVSFDVPKYQQMLEEKKNALYTDQKNKLSDLQNQKLSLVESQAYFTQLLNINNLGDLDSSYKTDLNFEYGVPKINTDSIGSDSLQLGGIPKYNDSLALLERKNAILNDISQLQRKINQANNSIKTVENGLTNIDELYNKNMTKTGKINKYKNQVFSNLNRLELGMSTPDFSPLLLQGINLQGLNFEWENKHYISLAHGTTSNPLFYSNDPLQNYLKYTQNVFNFFDFGNIKNGRRVTAVKAGYGAKEGNHIYIGALHGLSQTTQMLGDIGNQNAVNGPVEKNYVIELDGRMGFSETHYAEVFIAKSYLHLDPSEEIKLGKGYSRIFNQERSNGLLARYHVGIPKIKSNFKATFRWVDPFFKSFGLGFLRSDNVRYELSSDHRLTKSIQLGLKFKKERDNLLGLYDYNNILTTAGSQLKIKVFPRMNLILGYYPVLHKLSTWEFTHINKNHIANAVVTFAPKSKKINQLFTLGYNHYLIQSDSTNQNYKTVNFNYEMYLNKGHKFNLLSNWMQYHLPDSAAKETLLSAMGLFYKIGPKISVNGQIKHSYLKTTQNHSFGYGLGTTYQMNKYMQWDFSAEKIVEGEYYTTLNSNFSQDFPYFINIKLTNYF